MSEEQKKQSELHKVVITKVDIPFGNLLDLMIKVGIASIPAAIIVALVYYIFVSVLGLLLGTT